MMRVKQRHTHAKYLFNNSVKSHQTPFEIFEAPSKRNEAVCGSYAVTTLDSELKGQSPNGMSIVHTFS